MEFQIIARKSDFMVEAKNGAMLYSSLLAIGQKIPVDAYAPHRIFAIWGFEAVI